VNFRDKVKAGLLDEVDDFMIDVERVNVSKSFDYSSNEMTSSLSLHLPGPKIF
jgi:hypothetical protein